MVNSSLSSVANGIFEFLTSSLKNRCKQIRIFHYQQIEFPIILKPFLTILATRIFLATRSKAADVGMDLAHPFNPVLNLSCVRKTWYGLQLWCSCVTEILQLQAKLKVTTHLILPLPSHFHKYFHLFLKQFCSLDTTPAP